MTRFPNLARRSGDKNSWPAVDKQVLCELKSADIPASDPFEIFRGRGEVPTAYIGMLCKWTFERFWYYWVAKGPGVPCEAAEEFHKTWGQQVRVDGMAGGVSPLEWFEGFAVGTYHIDTQEGLTAFAGLLRSIHKPRT